MPLISKVGLTRGRNLLLLCIFYTVLALGSVTMIVPFLMTLTTSVSNQYDLAQYNVIPRFLYDDDALFIKFLFRKYESQQNTYDTIKRLYLISKADTVTDLTEAKDPLHTVFPQLAYDRWDKEKLATAWKDYQDFWKEIQTSGDVEKIRTLVPTYQPENTRLFQQYLRDKYLAIWRKNNPAEAAKWNAVDQEKAALALLNHTWGTTAGTTFNYISMFEGRGEFGRLAVQDTGPRTKDLMDFVATLPANQVRMNEADWYYQQFLREQYGTIVKLNADWGTTFTNFGEILFPVHLPANKKAAEKWGLYLTTRSTTFRMFKVSFPHHPSDAEFRAWLIEKHTDLAGINAALKTKFQSLDEITFTPTMPANRLLRSSWNDFAVLRIPFDQWEITGICRFYHAFLLKRYGSIEKINAAYGQAYAGIDDVRPPEAAFDRMEFLQRKPELVFYFLTSNFVQVFRYVALQGRALWNTFVLVGMSLLAALTINPMAAYALSRFKIKNKQAILILFLLPMSFPGEVTHIPSFILVRDLGLLNTYWALILPGLAHGFSIFMLKGFFDGLPRELYEAAELDGASEWKIYWAITFPLCKPILALTVLGTVVGAYSGYMWALVICPAQEKWTLAVWIFQFSVDAMQKDQAHLQMAALVLMSIPTMIIFIYTQRIIMKGIVLPTMK